MKVKRREVLSAASAAGATAMAETGRGAQAGGQTFPSRPIRWIIPFAAAGNYDVTSRLVGEAMGRRLGQTVIPDNRPGAGGIVGLGGGGQAPADGSTLGR